MLKSIIFHYRNTYVEHVYFTIITNIVRWLDQIRIQAYKCDAKVKMYWLRAIIWISNILNAVIFFYFCFNCLDPLSKFFLLGIFFFNTKRNHCSGGRVLHAAPELQLAKPASRLRFFCLFLLSIKPILHTALINVSHCTATFDFLLNVCRVFIFCVSVSSTTYSIVNAFWPFASQQFLHRFPNNWMSFLMQSALHIVWNVLYKKTFHTF